MDDFKPVANLLETTDGILTANLTDKSQQLEAGTELYTLKQIKELVEREYVPKQQVINEMQASETIQDFQDRMKLEANPEWDVDPGEAN